MFYNTPRLPRALLHPLIVYEQVSEPGLSGQFRPVTKAVSVFRGAVLPMSNEDWKLLPEGSYTQNAQKLYTDDPVTLKPGQIVRDTFDGQRYTVKTMLAHNSIHPMLRYIVEGVVGK